MDLVVQLSDVVLPPGDLLLQLGDPAQQLTLLGLKQKDVISDVEVSLCCCQVFIYSPSLTDFKCNSPSDFQNKVKGRELKAQSDRPLT